MKTFDLTFNGALLPGHDPQQVKRDFALLFSIDDPAVVEEVFSGETLILRHNLDRKTAADYFRKIAQLGSQATLVNSTGGSADPVDKLGKLELVVGAPPRVIRGPGPSQEVDSDNPFRQTGEIHQSWPISTARTHRQREERAGPKTLQKIADNRTETAPISEVIPSFDHAIPFEAPPTIMQAEDSWSAASPDTATEGSAQKNLFLTESRQAISRLRALAAKTKSNLQVKSTALQRRREVIDATANERLAEVEQLSETTRQRSEQATTELYKLEGKELQTGKALTTATKQREKLTQEQANHEVAQLNAQRKQAAEEDATVLAQLKQSLEETRLAAANELGRLRKLLQDYQREAKIDIGALENQLSNVKAKAHCEMTTLELCRDQALHELEQKIQKLQQRCASAKQHAAKNFAQLKQQQQEKQDREDEELRRLHTLKLEIAHQQEREVAEVEHANARLRTRTQKALKKMHSMELETKRQQRNALQRGSGIEPSQSGSADQMEPHP